MRHGELKEILEILRKGKTTPGFREAYEKLYRNYFCRLVTELTYGKSYYGKFTMKVTSKEIAEDIVGDFFYEFLRGEKYLQLREDSTDAAAWFYRVFMNFTLDRIRHHRTDATFYSVADPDMETLKTEEDFAENTVKRLVLVQAINTLDQQEQQLFEERLVKEESFRQIQNRMKQEGKHLEETSIRSQSMRIRQKLQIYLKQQGYGR